MVNRWIKADINMLWCQGCTSLIIKKNNKRQSYNIAHLQVEEGPKSTIFVINLEINKRIYLEAST